MNSDQKMNSDQDQYINPDHQLHTETRLNALDEVIEHILNQSDPITKYHALCDKASSSERLLSTLMLNMHKSEAIGVAWHFFYKAPYMWKGHSSKLNIKTRLENYYEDDGKFPIDTVLHYTQDGKIYCKSTDKDKDGNEYGEQPIFYWGEFEIDNHDFELCFDRLKEGVIEFKPKQEASYYNTKNLIHI